MTSWFPCIYIWVQYEYNVDIMFYMGAIQKTDVRAEGEGDRTRIDIFLAYIHSWDDVWIKLS